ncbi:MAG: PA4642 family protein [Porticoccaceae bacterium]|nr:PA4642 family protein [Porticoccaceae bacterium]
MALKKDKQKILGEVFDEERVKSFLDYQPPEGVNKDFHLLEKAYRGMNIDNFISFVDFFNQAGYDINSKNPNGMTIVQVIQKHKQATSYVQALIHAGACA